MAKKGELNMKFVVDTSKPAKNLKELQGRVQKLRDTIEGAPLGSEEFKKLTAQLQTAGSEVKVLEKNMEGLEPQQKAEAFLKMGEGIVGAFAVAQGALGLMGIENENLEKIQVRVQSAIAIATGIRMMSEAALMFATAKRVAVEKLGLIQTKLGVMWSKAAAVGNALWAVGQGVLTGSIAATTVGLVALKAAIIATGIGALALLIIGLVVAVYSYVSSNDSASASADRLAASIRKANKALHEKTQAVLDSAKSLEQKISREYELIDAETEAEKIAIKRKHHLSDMQSSMENMITVQESNNDLLKEQIESGDGVNATLKENVKIMNERIDAYETQIRLQHEFVRAADAEVEVEKKQEERRKSYSSKREERANQLIKDKENLRKLENELLLLEIADDDLREQSKIEQQRQESLRGAESILDEETRKATIAEINDKYDILESNRLDKQIFKAGQKGRDDAKDAEKIKEENQKERNKLAAEGLIEFERSQKEARDLELADVRAHAEKMLEADNLTGEERLALQEDLKIKEKEINDRFDEEEKAARAERVGQYLDTLTQTLSALQANMDAASAEMDSQLAKDLAANEGNKDAQDKIQKKFDAKKNRMHKRAQKVSAALAIIETYKSATEAFSSLAPIPFVGPILGGLAAGAAIAAGLANVRQIYAQDVGGGSGGGGGGGGASAGGGAAPKTAVPTTGAFSLGGVNKEIKPVKAYVVTDELTDSQDQLEGIREQSTI